MLIVDPNILSSTYNGIVRRYGGQYSFFQRIRMGRVGSPFIEYVSGISTFDEIHQSSASEKSKVNFGLLKNGLMIRINKKQQLGIALAYLNEVESIQINTFNKAKFNEDQFVGTLSLQITKEPPFICQIGPEALEGLVEFFNLSPFEGKLIRES